MNCNKRKLNIYILLIVTLSLAFISTFGFITHKTSHKKPKKRTVIHNLYKVTHNLSTKTQDLSTDKTNKRLLLSYKLNKHGKEVIDKKVKVQQTSYKTIKGIATAYVAMCETQCTGITRTGYDVRNTIYYNGMRIIAVDPKVIPLYSIVEITYGDVSIRCIALDTGGRINFHHVDLLMSDRQNAVSFGVKQIEIKILREGKGNEKLGVS